MRTSSRCGRPRRGRTDITKANGLGADKHFRGQNPQGGTAISYYLKAAATGDVKITISDSTGRVVREMDGTKDAGLNRVQWNLGPTPVLGGRGAGFAAAVVAGEEAAAVVACRSPSARTRSIREPTSSSSRSAARNC